MNNYKRVNELTNEVERFLKANGTNNEGVWEVPKDLFLETLVDAHVKEVKGGNTTIETELNFLNRRISFKFRQTHDRIAHLEDRDEFFQRVSAEIVNHVQTLDRDFIRLESSVGLDDIGYLVLLIDRKCHREVLEDNGITYDTNSKEFTNHLKGSISLDSEVEDDGNITSFGELLGTDDVIASHQDSDIDIERMERTMSEFNLTKRQQEVILEYINSNYNQSETARRMGVTQQSITTTINRARERATKNYRKEAYAPFSGLEAVLDSPKMSVDSVFDYIIVNYNSDRELENIVYEVDCEIRKTFVRAMKDKTVFASDKNKFVMEFLKIYYNKCKK